MAWPFRRSPAADTAEQVVRPRALTAAGQRVTVQTARAQSTRRDVAQQRAAWAYRRAVPEAGFAGSFVNGQVGRVRWFAAEDPGDGTDPISMLVDRGPGPDGAEPKVSERTRQIAIEGVQRLDLNRRGASMAGRLAESHDFVGECFLLGMTNPETALEEWTIRSTSEVQIGTDGVVRLVEPGRSAEGLQLNLDQVALYRLWNPDTEYHDWPYAKMTANLGILEEILLYDRQKRAIARSRLASGAMLYIPEELSLTRAGAAPVSAELPASEDDDDPLMDELAAAWREPVQNEESPEALVPIVIRGPAMGPDGATPYKNLIGVVMVPREEIADILAKRDAAVLAFAHGIDFPEERLTGMGKTNHWNGAVISDSEVKNHIEPRCENAADSLTSAFLRSYLLAHDCPPEEVRWCCVWFDASELAQPADPWALSKDAHASGVISDDRLRRDGGYSDGDAPGDVEAILRGLRAGTLLPETLPVYVALADLDPGQRAQVEAALTAMQQIALSRRVAAPGGVEPRVIDAVPTGTTQRPASTPTPVSTSGPRVSLTAAAGRKGPKDDPQGPSVAGVALVDGNTGRVLMLQRGLDDPADPAAGTWEFPGGHVEDGDETSLHAGMREWAEEVGRPFPEGGLVAHTWTSPNGVYQGHLVVLPGAEGLVDLDGARTVSNADDDYSEQSAWWDLDMARRMGPALRPEVKSGTPWPALKRAAQRPVTASAGDGRDHGGRYSSAGRHWKVQEQLSRELGKVDQQLVAELGGFYDALILRTVEQAANRIRNGALRASAEERGMFETGQRDPATRRPTAADAVTIVAAAGGQFPWTVTDQQALEGALDRGRLWWLRAIRAAAKRVAAVLARLTGEQPDPALIEGMERRAVEAWPELAQRIEATTLDVLHGRVPDDDPERPDDLLVEDAPDRDADGDGVADTVLPRDAITRAITDVGGRPAEVGDGVAPRSTGLTSGTAVVETVEKAGGSGLGFEWQWYSHPRAPFQPHLDLSGARFDGFDDDRLAVQAGHEAWIGRGHYSPGDHKGCGCSTYIVWATPVDSEEPRSAADTMLTDTARQARVREVAEADDAGPGYGTLPGGQTHLQRDRDRTDELREHRRRHITDREAV